MFRILSSFVSTLLWISIGGTLWVWTNKVCSFFTQAQVILFIQRYKMEIARTFMYFMHIYQGKVLIRERFRPSLNLACVTKNWEV